MSDELKTLPAHAEKPFWKVAGLIASSWIARMPRQATESGINFNSASGCRPWP